MSDSNKPRQLTVAIVVRNGADGLRETIDSIRSIADSIVVLDTGSTDTTLTVAQELADVVVERPWDDDFSTARNYLAKQIDTPWILWLDAGERLDADDAAALRQFVEQEADSKCAYMMLVHVPRAMQNIAAEQAGRIRLVPNDPGLQFKGRVREQLNASMESLSMRFEGLPWNIYRGARDHDPETLVRKARRNLTLADLELKQSGPTARMWNCIGEAKQVIGDTEGATLAFKQALTLSQRESDDMIEAYYGLLTSLDGADTKHQSQLTICLQALEIFPLDAQLLCAMGGYLQSQARFDLAARSYQTAFQFGQVRPEVWHLQGINEIAATSCSLAMQLDGKEDEAVKLLYEAAAEAPASQGLRRRLLDLLVQRGERDAALAQVEHLTMPDEQRNLLRSAVRGGSLASQKNWLSSRSHLQTAYDAGCRDPLCMRWFGVSLLAMGATSRANDIFLEWSKLAPTNPEPRQYLEAMIEPSIQQTVATDVAAGTDSENSSRQIRIDNRSAPTVRHAPTSSPIDAPTPSTEV